MFDNEKLMAALTAYKQYFPLHWKDEKYKWEAVQYFQNNWDIEAENFLDMFMKATDKTFNLLASMNNYPMRRKTPCFSYGDIRRVHRIYASN